MKALSLSARGCRGLYRYLIRSSESMGYTPDEDLEAIASRMTVEMMTRITLITIAVDTSNASLPETLVAGASLPGPSLGLDSSSSNNIAVSRIENSQAAHGICNPVVNHVRIHGPQIVQATQVAQVIKELNYISTELRDGNCPTASGSSGPDGHGRHFGDIAPVDRRYHRVFVFHRDTIWYLAFDRLASESPLPLEYCMKRKNFDLDYGKDIVFHVLVPSWYKLCIREPLHFPADLYPLRIEGELYHGKMVVEMNLPAAPPLHPRGSFLNPGHWDTIAAAVGWGAIGACLALGVSVGAGALTGLGALVAVPIWFATAPKAIEITHSVICPAVYDTLREEAPRTLGSTQRLDREARRKNGQVLERECLRYSDLPCRPQLQYWTSSEDGSQKGNASRYQADR
ncbi:uncharacterized protein BO95DRAFT_454701 [Aspergillus brunneoviolaceus CBS 621.78]|uniref:Uncharacterized protein n=1 Tax=Aspergillus brunneoviolaceus CBS 621.78 TaxID=1450534 RepID=A0ACD1G3R8_9EURO|nr:hypothetical protein BO95DRAFT_454701 [Aspergillus brunneoviolaceus CBS 621.78]RAH43786.1 hypothetical protein BO95DRAFT_454701 [Aspergillus brunneoviolaceus CBS 621.78]